MADQASAVHDEEQLPARERPWLLPYNRKLRHLQGITLRNLTLTPANVTRSRGKTIDDEAVPSTFKSPTKALAIRESKSLAHSRSSTDLKLPEDGIGSSNGHVRQPSTPTRPSRPAFGRSLRRRTTMEWANASPMTRQRKLEDLSAVRLADTFFVLQVEDQSEPIYISEVVEKAMNPNFRFFDLDPCGPSVTRRDQLNIKVWAKNESQHVWQYLLNYAVNLQTLQFIGKDLGSFRHPLPANCVLFHMTDGIYTSFTDVPSRVSPARSVFAPPKTHADGKALPSSSYDALMRLSTLDDCIQDALTTRDRIVDDIENIITKHGEDFLTLRQVPETDENLRVVQVAVNSEKRRVDAARRKCADLKASIQFRRQKIHAGTAQEQKLTESLPEQRTKHQELKEETERLDEDLAGQRRRLCEDVQRIYPIEPVPGKALTFTIRGLLLPNSDFEDAKEDVTAAALNFVAQVVQQLSLYLAVILPYPIALSGSTSTIDDPLAIGHNTQNNPRTYPLYMKGVVRYRFEYGIFLLNKNIEILLNALGVRPVDIRHTLPNLKYLLYVATAGKGELPARKAGGIRGLLKVDGLRSRKGSMDSMATSGSHGSPMMEPKRSLDIVRTKHGDTSPGNGSLSSTVSSWKHKGIAGTGSRLRPVD